MNAHEELQVEVEVCTWHPRIETALHCYQCERPICFKCAKRTPVGYICRECEKGRKGRFERATLTDYVIAALVPLPLAFFASIFLPMLSWLTIFLSPLAGTLIAEVVWRLIGRRYGSRLWWVVAGSIVVGSFPLLLPLALNVYLMGSGEQALIGGLNLLWIGLHLALTLGAAIARLKL